MTSDEWQVLLPGSPRQRRETPFTGHRTPGLALSLSPSGASQPTVSVSGGRVTGYLPAWQGSSWAQCVLDLGLITEQAKKESGDSGINSLFPPGQKHGPVSFRGG